MALEAAEEERLVLAVIHVRNADGSAGRRAHFVISEWIARNDRVRKRRRLAALQLLEILAVDQSAVEVPVFGLPWNWLVPLFITPESCPPEL